MNFNQKFDDQLNKTTDRTKRKRIKAEKEEGVMNTFFALHKLVVTRVADFILNPIWLRCKKNTSFVLHSRTTTTAKRRSIHNYLFDFACW